MPVFFDGIPTYVPYDGNLDLARFTTNDLASIEVNKGYTSLLQGPNLMGGAINITILFYVSEGIFIGSTRCPAYFYHATLIIC
ncbi:TonB-dependent receptor [Pseudomonas aeruginosa]|uniref:TonB-dependent receptor n=1 Tax=Pseudomonas aeruginosa TaxID=287 RepID=UPI00217D8E24|nr:Plug domain-containing protein [Pseudomonas aeruginosa]